MQHAPAIANRSAFNVQALIITAASGCLADRFHRNLEIKALGIMLPPGGPASH